MDLVWSLGPFTLTYTMATLVISLVGGWVYLRFGIQITSKHIRERALNVIFYGLITFYLGKILFHFPLFLSDPFALISYPSGSSELLLAVIVVATYAVYLYVRTPKTLSPVMQHVFLFLVASETLWHVFHTVSGKSALWLPGIDAHPISLYFMLINSFVLVLMKNRHNLYIWMGAWFLVRWLVGFLGINHLYFMIPVPNLYFLVPALLLLGAALFTRKVT